MRSIEWRNIPPLPPSGPTEPTIRRNVAALPVFGEDRLGLLALDRAEAVEATEVVHAVHAEDPTAIALA